MGVSNISNSQKTIKKELSLLESDAYSIDRIIKYIEFYDSKDNAVFIAEFGNILDKYRDYFDNYLVDVDVPNKFFYQPAAFAEYYYGTPDLDFVVLYFAKMSSLFDFNRSVIRAIPKTKIMELNRLFVEYKSEVNNSYKNPKLYTK